jgi:transposase
VSKLSTRGDSHDKTSINQQKARKQHTPEFRNEALKLAERIIALILALAR